MAKISWLNWVRLALIPAGGDWRDLPKAIEPAPENPGKHHNKLKMVGVGPADAHRDRRRRPRCGAPSVADPRLAEALALPADDVPDDARRE
jgi:hypothetical protein